MYLVSRVKAAAKQYLQLDPLHTKSDLLVKIEPREHNKDNCYLFDHPLSKKNISKVLGIRASFIPTAVSLWVAHSLLADSSKAYKCYTGIKTSVKSCCMQFEHNKLYRQ